jgi:hypothetical protein
MARRQREDSSVELAAEGREQHTSHSSWMEWPNTQLVSGMQIVTVINRAGKAIKSATIREVFRRRGCGGIHVVTSEGHESCYDTCARTRVRAHDVPHTIEVDDVSLGKLVKKRSLTTRQAPIVS